MIGLKADVRSRHSEGDFAPLGEIHGWGAGRTRVNIGFAVTFEGNGHRAS